MTNKDQQKRQQRNAARKARKKAFREAAHSEYHRQPRPNTHAHTYQATEFSPGTSTRFAQYRQARRWLGNERRIDPPRFPRHAIREVEQLFHRDKVVRANHSYGTMSSEAKQIIATLDAECAVQAGENGGDWWVGPERKRITIAQQKEFKVARDVSKATSGLQTLGLEVVGEGDKMDMTEG
ncbi:MAG: hypothetical protein Q9205_008047 [Flavoplaca limonia]